MFAGFAENSISVQVHGVDRFGGGNREYPVACGECQSAMISTKWSVITNILIRIETLRRERGERKVESLNLRYHREEGGK